LKENWQQKKQNRSAQEPVISLTLVCTTLINRTKWGLFIMRQPISLNSQLLKEPDKNPSLLKILFQFSHGIIAVCAVIWEMFLQVKVKESDQDSFRFLWRDSYGNIEVYKMQLLIFRATCSPCCAQYVKNQNAWIATNRKKAGIKAIQENH